MYAIRVHLERPGGKPDGRPVAPVAPAVRDGLERGLRGPARLGHARIRMTAQALDAVVFVSAGNLLVAEDGLRTAWHELTSAGGVLSGWQLLHCEADYRLALGLYELPSRP
ncbi:hypothetical protein [Kitasatospora sp. NPDC057223]|uniref:hypothetical protein n=1 Tax=Kitasatospora sp. NPDC057223 TaxID=3346055 RepID=UPI00362D97D6